MQGSGATAAPGGDRSSALQEQQGGSREVRVRGDGREPREGGSSSGWCGKPRESFAWDEGRRGHEGWQSVKSWWHQRVVGITVPEGRSRAGGRRMDAQNRDPGRALSLGKDKR